MVERGELDEDGGCHRKRRRNRNEVEITEGKLEFES